MQDSAVIYCRVSSLKQVKEGHGLDSQEKRCRDYAQMMNWRVIEVYRDEGVSGAKADRPAFSRMMDDLSKRNDSTFVIIDDYKRFARDLDVYIHLKKGLDMIGGKLVSPSGNFDDSPEGEALEQVQAVFAELERKQNARQVRNRMKARLEEGYYVLGACPFGYKPGIGVKVPYEPAASTVKEALEGYAYGTLKSFEDVARFMNSRSLTRYDGRTVLFDGDRAKLMLRGSWFHAGYLECLAMDVTRRPARHKPIISTDVLELIELRLQKKPLPKYRKNLDRCFPLRGHLICGCCNRRMTAAYSGGRNKKYGYYTCKNGSCDMYNRNHKMESVHEEFETLLQGVTPEAELVDLALELLVDEWDVFKTTQREQLAGYQTELREVNTLVQKLVYEATEASSPVVKKAIHERIEEASNRKANLQFIIKNTELDDTDFKQVANAVSGILREPYRLWRESDLSRKQLIQELVFPEGIVLGEGKKFRKPAKALPYGVIADFEVKKTGLVDSNGIEPSTFAMPLRRSPS